MKTETQETQEIDMPEIDMPEPYEETPETTLSNLYVEKRLDIMRLAIDKPTMVGDNYVRDQFNNYEVRYNKAKLTKAAGRTATDKAVIQAYEASASTVGALFELLDNVRSKIAEGIEAGADVSAQIGAVEAIEMSAITPEAIEAIKTQFGV